MRAVKRFIDIVGTEIAIGTVCLGAASVGSACAQSAINGSSQGAEQTTSQVPAEYGKPVLGSEVNQRQARVEWRQGKLSVSAEMALLSRVLQQVSAQTGIEFLNLDKLHVRISVHFSNVPLRVGLKTLLADMDYGAIGEPDDPRTMRMVVLEPAMLASAMAGPTPAPSVHQQAPLHAEDLDPTTDLSVLGEALGDENEEVKQAAIQALAERGGSEALDLLRQVFRDSDSAAKMMMIDNIGSTPEALPLLREASQDSDMSVRKAALAAISQ